MCPCVDYLPWAAIHTIILKTFRENRYTDGFKTEYIQQMYLNLFVESCQMLHTQLIFVNTWKTTLGNALFLFPFIPGQEINPQH